MALGPACGGGSGGGGAAVTPIVLPVVVASLPPDASPATQTIDVSALTDAQAQAALQAALNAGTPGKIVLTTGGPTRTIVLTAGLNMPSNSGGPKSAILDGSDQITLSGNLSVRILELQDLAQLTVQRMKFVDGRASQNGGAINSAARVRQVTLIDCDFTNCDTTSTGPDIGGGAVRLWNGEHTQISNCTFTNCSGSNGGAVNSLGTRLTIINSTFTANSAFGTGGGADVGPSGQGGIGGAVYVDNVSNHPTALRQLSITGCTFTSNQANDHAGAVFGYTNAAAPSTTIVDRCTFANNSVTGGNGHSGAFYSQDGTLNLTNTTFSSNTSTGVAGAVFSTNSVANLTNCTFHANSCGVLGGGLFTTKGVVTLTNGTFSQNQAGDFAGGVFSNGTTSTTIDNCIFHANTALGNPFAGDQINSSFSGQGNLQSPDSALPGGKSVTVTGTTRVADALLGPLQNNGGPTMTRLPNAGSPAIDLPGSSSAPATDQRGNARNGAPDAGAVER